MVEINQEHVILLNKGFRLKADTTTVYKMPFIDRDIFAVDFLDSDDFGYFGNMKRFPLASEAIAFAQTTTKIPLFEIPT